MVSPGEIAGVRVRAKHRSRSLGYDQAIRYHDLGIRADRSLDRLMGTRSLHSVRTSDIVTTRDFVDETGSQNNSGKNRSLELFPQGPEVHLQGADRGDVLE